MSPWESALTTAAATIGTLVLLSRIARGWLVRVIQGVVDASVRDVIARQVQFEKRQREHLNRQDRKLERIQSAIDKRFR